MGQSESGKAKEVTLKDRPDIHTSPLTLQRSALAASPWLGPGAWAFSSIAKWVEGFEKEPLCHPPPLQAREKGFFLGFRIR